VRFQKREEKSQKDLPEKRVKKKKRKRPAAP